MAWAPCYSFHVPARFTASPTTPAEGGGKPPTAGCNDYGWGAKPMLYYQIDCLLDYELIYVLVI